MAQPFRISLSTLPSPGSCISRSHRGRSHLEPQPHCSHPLFLSFPSLLCPSLSPSSDPLPDFSLRHVNPPQPSPRLATKQGSRPGKRITARQEGHRPLNRNFRPKLRSPQPTPLPPLPFLLSLPLSLSISLLLSPPAPLFAAALSLARDRAGETVTSTLCRSRCGRWPGAVVVVDGDTGPLSTPFLPPLSSFLSHPFPLSLRLER